eukprot:15352093-Ditylum_brightwellii.AAC.1
MGFHTEDTWYVGLALRHYRCYTVVMKEKAAQWITDTIKFKHHRGKVPTVTPAERVAKAMKKLTTQRLRAVLLKEQQPTCDEPYRSVEKYATPQQQPVTTKEPIPTNPILSCYPALILCQLDKIEQPAINEAPKIPIAPPRHYNLREKATHIINSVIFEESPNVQNAVGTPKHIAKYTTALKHLLVTEAYKAEMHAPTGMFAGSIIDPETSHQLQYKDSIQQDKYCNVWIKAFTKKLDQLAQGKCGDKGTNTIFLIKRDDMLKGQTATYGSI